MRVRQEGQVAIGPFIFFGGMNLLQEREEQYFGFGVESSRTMRLYFVMRDSDRWRSTMWVGIVVAQHLKVVFDLYALLNASGSKSAKLGSG